MDHIPTNSTNSQVSPFVAYALKAVDVKRIKDSKSDKFCKKSKPNCMFVHNKIHTTCLFSQFQEETIYLWA